MGRIPRRLTDPALGGSWPNFSPDGSQIAFEVNRDGFAYPYLMLADGSQTYGHWARDPGIARSGRRMAAGSCLSPALTA